MSEPRHDGAGAPKRAIRGARLRLVAFLSVATALAPPASAQEAAGWLVAGPFDASGLGAVVDGLDIDFLASSGMSASGEAAARPSLVQAVGAKAWKDAASAGIGNGEGVDFIAAFGKAEGSVGYAYRTYRSAASVAAVMRIGSDDGVKVWLNGELVFGNHTHRSLAEDQDAVLVSLKEGENRVLVKVDQGWGSWGFRLRFADPERERREARLVRPDSLVVCLDEDSARRDGAISGVVMTSPAALVDGAAAIELLDDSGRRVGAAAAPISGRFSLRVPADTPEFCRVRAVGSGGAAGLASRPASIVVGDPAALSRAALATARTAAASLSRRQAPSPRAPSLGRACPDPAATLEFLAAELEGRVPEVLLTRESAILALRDIRSVAYGTSPLPGLHRYAYRSAVDGSVQPYSLYVPEGYDPGRRYGLVLALHGASGNDWDMAASVAGGKPQDMLVAAPYGRGDLGWTATGELDAMDVLDLTLAGYSIDPDRVYLTGRSMGGFGTWRLGQLYARRFAAIAPFAGWIGADCLEDLVNTPVLVVHGEDDQTVSIADDRAAVELLEDLGAKVRFDALPGVGHDAFEAWTKEEGPNRLIDWLRKWRRESWPDEVKARASQARYGRQAWVSIVGVSTPLSPAAVDAIVVDERHLTVETENVSVFALDLRHPKLAKSGRLLILVDGRNLTADAASPEARFELGEDGRFRTVKAAPSGGAAAPLSDASAADENAADALASTVLPNGGAGFAGLFDGPVCFVYGTAKRSRAAINEEAALALTGKDKEGILSAGASLGAFSVIPDTAVDDELMASSSLVLVGGVDENRILARLAGKLPLSIARGAVEVDGQVFKGAGMIMVCPNPEAPGRLVCVFDLPFKKDEVVGYAGGLSIAMRAFSADYGTCGFGTPDVMIVDSSLKTAWSGCFDWSWKNLLAR